MIFVNVLLFLLGVSVGLVAITISLCICYCIFFAVVGAINTSGTEEKPPVQDGHTGPLQGRPNIGKRPKGEM